MQSNGHCCRAFSKEIVRLARQKGMQITEPQAYGVNGFGELEPMFQSIRTNIRFVTNNSRFVAILYRFVMYIDDKSQKSHGTRLPSMQRS